LRLFWKVFWRVWLCGSLAVLALSGAYSAPRFFLSYLLGAGVGLFGLSLIAAASGAFVRIALASQDGTGTARARLARGTLLTARLLALAGMLWLVLLWKQISLGGLIVGLGSTQAALVMTVLVGAWMKLDFGRGS